MSQDHGVSAAAPPSPDPGRPAPSPPVVAEVLALASAAVTTTLLVAVGIIATARRGELESALGPAAAEADAVQLINTLVGLSAIATLAALVTTAWWLQGLRDVAQWCNPHHRQRRSTAWVLLGWVVPVVNLWFPYQVVADASRAVGSGVRNFWPWWISWLVLVHGNLLFDRRSGGLGELESTTDVARYVLGYQVGAALMVLALVLWWRVVRSATTAAGAAVQPHRVSP